MNSKTTIKLYFLLFAMLGLASCQLDQGEDPLASTFGTGYIVAGETGDRVIVTELNIELDGEDLNNRTYDHKFDTGGDIALSFSATYGINTDGFYAYNMVRGTQDKVEIVITSITDSMMVCNNLSSGNVQLFNSSQPINCNGQLSFDELNYVSFPLYFRKNDLVRQSLPRFGSGSRTNMSTHYTFSNGAGSTREYIQNYPLWRALSGYHFLGFRWLDGSRWRYGYVEMAITGDSKMSIKRIATEV